MLQKELLNLKTQLYEKSIEQLRENARKIVEENKDNLLELVSNDIIEKQYDISEISTELTTELTTEPHLLKPGYKTSEFWVTIGTQIISLAAAFGLLTNDQVSTWTNIFIQVAGIVGAMVSAFGYSLARGNAKKGY